MEITAAECTQARRLIGTALNILKKHPTDSHELAWYETAVALDKACTWIEDLRTCAKYENSQGAEVAA